MYVHRTLKMSFIRSRGVPAIQGFIVYRMNEDSIRTSVSGHYRACVRNSGVSVNRGSIVYPVIYHQPLYHSPIIAAPLEPSDGWSWFQHSQKHRLNSGCQCIQPCSTLRLVVHATSITLHVQDGFQMGPGWYHQQMTLQGSLKLCCWLTTIKLVVIRACHCCHLSHHIIS